MAELGFSCPAATTSSSSTTGLDIQKRVLIRTGNVVLQDTVIDILDPGPGWTATGEQVTFSGADEFTDLTQVYRNGVHQLTGASAGANNDVYFVSVSGNIAFEMNIVPNDILQFWKFNPTTSG